MEPRSDPRPDGPLAGLRVIDAAVLFAGPVIGTLLADFGADVIKVEHPRGDALRTLGWQKDGTSLWWAFVNRNKRLVSIDLGEPEGAELLQGARPRRRRPHRVLPARARSSAGASAPDVLSAINPRLVMVRCSGYGQTGPYSPRPGFGTVAESISGFAHINGHPDGPPTLPPFALGDGVASLFGTFATMFALWHRDVHGAPGQVIDLAIYEPLFWLLGPQSLVYDQLGHVPGAERQQHRVDRAAQRVSARATAGGWASRPAPSRSRSGSCASWVTRRSWTSHGSATTTAASSTRTSSTRTSGPGSPPMTTTRSSPAFEAQEAVIGPIYSIADIFEDPQYAARETITTVDDPVLGRARVQNAVPRLSATPGRVRHLGRDLGHDNRDRPGRRAGPRPSENRAAPAGRRRRRSARLLGVPAGSPDG